MRHFLLTGLVISTLCSSVNAQVYGCMDPASSNYNPLATVSDGSCIYPVASVALKNLKKATLPSTASEISGMIYMNGKLYGHNDSDGEPAIYEIDTTTGAITKTITLQGATNVDWEDLTQDSEYIYVGDFGNTNGNRTDLKLYRFPKTDIGKITGTSGTIAAADIKEINFRYGDQTDFTARPANSTRYDCEAVIYDNGRLHLFTKNWLSDYTVHYVISADPLPGVQAAIRKDSLNTQGTLITGAARINNKTSILMGYEVTGYPSGALWFITGYSGVNKLFTSGNKRKVDLGKIVDVTGGGGIGQIEGLAMAGEKRVFISNEFFSRTLGITFTVPQSLYGLTITPWLPQYIVLPVGITGLSAKQKGDGVVLTWQYEAPGADHFNIEISKDGQHFSMEGTVKNIKIPGDKINFTDNSMAFSGRKFYRIKVVLPGGGYAYSKIISIKENKNDRFNLVASPSPFNNKLKLDFFCDKDQAVQLRLIDIDGRIVTAAKFNGAKGSNTWELNNLSGLSKSVYFVTAKTADGLYVKKLVRN